MDQIEIKIKRIEEQQKKKQESMDLLRENDIKEERELEEQYKQKIAETQSLNVEYQVVDIEVSHISQAYSFSTFYQLYLNLLCLLGWEQTQIIRNLWSHC